VFHGYRRAGIFLGWLMFILGELGFFFFCSIKVHSG